MGSQTRDDQVAEQASWVCDFIVLAMQEHMVGRASSHELFGYDFVVDEQLRVWLIECNCSPSLEHSTPVTAAMVTAVIHDLVKVCLSNMFVSP